MPEYVVLRHKDKAVGNFAAVVADGVEEDEVVAAWHTFGWSKASKADQETAADLVRPDQPVAE